jgi:hypothetical protein
MSRRKMAIPVSIGDYMICALEPGGHVNRKWGNCTAPTIYNIAVNSLYPPRIKDSKINFV